MGRPTNSAEPWFRAYITFRCLTRLLWSNHHTWLFNPGFTACCQLMGACKMSHGRSVLVTIMRMDGSYITGLILTCVKAARIVVLRLLEFFTIVQQLREGQSLGEGSHVRAWLACVAIRIKQYKRQGGGTFWAMFWRGKCCLRIAWSVSVGESSEYRPLKIAQIYTARMLSYSSIRLKVTCFVRNVRANVYVS